MINVVHRYDVGKLRAVTDSTTGTTIDAYAVALTLTSLGFANKLIVMKNTHATNGLTIKLDGYANRDGTAYSILGNTPLIALDIYQIEVTKSYDKIILSVKSTVGSTPATYTLDYCMRQEGV
jgi:hypothetical protein